MAFRFAFLCDLLERLEDNRIKKCLPEAKCRDVDRETIVHWFNQHSANIARKGDSAIAFLSCLFPERRVDRVYGLRERKLSFTLGRCLRLGVQRRTQFEKDVLDGLDVAKCVEKYLREAELPLPQPGTEVTLEEIDLMLDQIAASSRFSGQELRLRVPARRPDEALEPVFLRLQSREAKWLTRMILKNFSPVMVPEALCMNEYHFLLYDLLAFQDSFAAAINIIQDPSIVRLAPRQSSELVKALKEEVRDVFVPKVNIFVRRQPYHKARSIKHCAQLSHGRQMSLERKYDGEYCQVHIKIDSDSPITIFSKSGKVSTMDRINVHESLKKGLRLGESRCRVSSQCILEGELLVWNDSKKAIQPFRTIRKHVNRSGVFLGAEQDSPGHPDDHLMVVFYDVLLWDNVFCLKQPHHQRRKILKNLIRLIEGRIDITDRETIDFRSRTAPEKLRMAFARSITQRWEGLVLKGFDDSYSVLPSSRRGIKMKKDYIKGLGDTEDFVVLGGRYNQHEDWEWQKAGIRTELDNIRLERLLWTSFHVACLENKTEVLRWDAKPAFRVVGVVSSRCIAKEDIVTLNQLGRFSQTAATGDEFQECFAFTVDQVQLPPMMTVFKKPIVVELMGAGFDRPSGVDYPMLRFPRVQKLHDDRSIQDIVGLDELKDKAKLAESTSGDSDTQEDARWIERLIQADGRNQYLIDHSQTTAPRRSPVTASTASTPPCFSTGLIKTQSPISPRGRWPGFVDAISPCMASSSRKRESSDATSESPTMKRIRTSQHNTINIPTSKAGPHVSKIYQRKPLQEISNHLPANTQTIQSSALHPAFNVPVSVSETGPFSLDTLPEAAQPQRNDPSAMGGNADFRSQRKKPKRHDTKHTKPEDLLTPPTSTPNEALSSSAMQRPPGVTAGAIRHDSPKSRQQLYVSSPKKDILHALQSAMTDQPILVNLQVEDPMLALSLVKMQNQMNASFTSSPRNFLRACLRFLKRPRASRTDKALEDYAALHIVLIDEEHMPAATIAKTTNDLIRTMTGPVRNGMKTKAPDAIVRKHTLMVLDRHTMAILNQVIEETIELSAASREIRRHFWGGFVWPLDETGNIGSTWDFEKLLSWLTA